MIKFVIEYKYLSNVTTVTTVTGVTRLFILFSQLFWEGILW